MSSQLSSFAMVQNTLHKRLNHKAPFGQACVCNTAQADADSSKRSLESTEMSARRGRIPLAYFHLPG